MNLNQTINSLDIFKNKNFSLNILKSQGLNNISYLLKIDKKSYVIRVFKNLESVNISRDFEFKVQSKAYKKSISAKTIFINKNFMIYEFAKGFHKTALNKKDIKRLALTIKNIHKIKIKSRKYNFLKDLKIYKDTLKDENSKKILLKLEKSILKSKKFKEDLALVHHDLNIKNILFKNKKITIIDWEYAGTNDIFFDIATLCIEFNLSKKDEKRFLKKYFKSIPKYAKKKLKIYKSIYTNISLLWFKKNSFSL
ncbi:choline/ethanolamine kinase family protein [Arcobacter porcinus]|uniref:choline/ethanolamine kinase family protein n=1 Tax=Arcobacter porcinus TaxID=1935204 RepID=UPI00081DBE5E|nr:choline/ethanolamine kinase family protein [Arcobacter porcinus]OCL82362.1 Thiamine kinase [Arcobacter porcinus]